MKMSGGVEWALHCCVVLTTSHTPVPAAKLAELHDVSSSYLAKQLQALARAGLIHSVQGKSGGYVLTRAPESITLLDVVRAVDGPGPPSSARRSASAARSRPGRRLHHAVPGRPRHVGGRGRVAPGARRGHDRRSRPRRRRHLRPRGAGRHPDLADRRSRRPPRSRRPRSAGVAYLGVPDLRPRTPQPPAHVDRAAVLVVVHLDPLVHLPGQRALLEPGVELVGRSQPTAMTTSASAGGRPKSTMLLCPEYARGKTTGRTVAGHRAGLAVVAGEDDRPRTLLRRQTHVDGREGVGERGPTDRLAGVVVDVDHEGGQPRRPAAPAAAARRWAAGTAPHPARATPDAARATRARPTPTATSARRR